jgi:hypothetical protein
MHQPDAPRSIDLNEQLQETAIAVKSFSKHNNSHSVQLALITAGDAGQRQPEAASIRQQVVNVLYHWHHPSLQPALC